MDIEGKLNQEVTYKVPTGLDANQDRTFGPEVTVAARIEPRMMLIRDFNGDEVMSSHVIYTADQVPLGAHFLIEGEWRRMQQRLGSPSLDASQTLHKAWAGSRK